MPPQTPAFDKVSKTILLINLLTKTWKHWRNEPMWSIIADICGVGSNTALEICNELTLDPHAKVNQTTVRNATTQLWNITPRRITSAPDYTSPNWDW